MKIEFRPITRDEARKYNGGILYPQITEVHGAFIDGNMVAMSGTLLDPVRYGTLFDDECHTIGFIDASEKARALGFRAVLAVRDRMRSMTVPMQVQCDEYRFPTAPKLLKALGFTETDRWERDALEPTRKLRIWKWEPSQSSA
jgi:hypothetical protein